MAARPLVVFFSLALVLTWIVWVPRALASHDVIRGPVAELALALGGVWSWAPAVAALLAAALTGGRRSVREWLGRLGRWRVGLRWYAVALLGPIAFALLAGAIAAVLGLGTMWPRALDGGLAAVGFFAVLLLTDGLGEEAGWRGFALPALLERYRAVVASLILGVFWAVWHLPLLYTEGTVMAGSPFLFHVLDLPAMSVLYTWLFLRTNGSALLAIVLHASINLWTPAGVPDGTIGQLALVLVMKWVLVAVVLGVVHAGAGRSPRSASGVA